MKIDVNRLKKLCTTDEWQLWESFARRKDYEDMGLYLFKDTGSNILVVAHMDVFSDKIKPTFTWDKVGTDIIIHSPWLDDRLGVFVADHMMPNVLKIKADILLTSDEECCKSTAADFATEMKSLKEYNWIVEFDRAGDDVVLYHYDDVPDLTEDLMEVGYDIGIGSYSDIGELEEFGVGCFNVGIGYHHQHTSYCFASMQEMADQLMKFKDFYHKNKDKKYIYTPKPHSRWSWMDSYYGLTEDDIYGYGNNLKYGTTSEATTGNTKGRWDSWKDIYKKGKGIKSYLGGKSNGSGYNGKRGYTAEDDDIKCHFINGQEMTDEEYQAWLDEYYDEVEGATTESRICSAVSSDLVPYGDTRVGSIDYETFKRNTKQVL
jgi:hypothetical protein